VRGVCVDVGQEPLSQEMRTNPSCNPKVQSWLVVEPPVHPKQDGWKGSNSGCEYPVTLVYIKVAGAIHECSSPHSCGSIDVVCPIPAILSYEKSPMNNPMIVSGPIQNLAVEIPEILAAKIQQPNHQAEMRSFLDASPYQTHHVW